MGGSFASRSVDQPVHFQDRANGTVVDGKLESVRLFLPEAGDREIVLVVWFDYWTFRRIDRAHLFGYTFESIDREGLQSWELTSERLVQMELRAEGAARAVVEELSGEALLDRAMSDLGGDDSTSPLLDVANYRYLAVYQQKELGGASFLSGFTSIYRKHA